MGACVAFDGRRGILTFFKSTGELMLFSQDGGPETGPMRISAAYPRLSRQPMGPRRLGEGRRPLGVPRGGARPLGVLHEDSAALPA